MSEHDNDKSTLSLSTLPSLEQIRVFSGEIILKNIALILAGGVGSRMGFETPKQFINIYDKPVIIYTLESFQKHPLIEEIYAVCVDKWHEVLKSYCSQYNITKLKQVFSGGSTAQESIRNGIFALSEIASPSDNIIIHDGVRPLVESEILSDVINKCTEYGNAVSSMPYNEQIFIKKDDFSTDKYIPRETLRRVSTPQAYKYDKLKWAYEKAFAENIGISPSSYTNTMMVDLGEVLYFAAGSDKNIKLTTRENLEMFKAFLKLDKN